MPKKPLTWDKGKQYNLYNPASDTSENLFHTSDNPGQNILGQLWQLRAILQESEAKLELKIFDSPSIFVWR